MIYPSDKSPNPNHVDEGETSDDAHDGHQPTHEGIQPPQDELLQTQSIDIYSAPKVSKLKSTLVYIERTPLVMVLPIILLISFILAYFVFCYFVAEVNSGLLGVQFLFGMPFFIGAVMVYIANLKSPVTIGRVFSLTFWIILGVILLSAPVLREGTICVVMGSPIIYFAMVLGGLIMRFICSKFWQTKILMSVNILPLLVLFVPLEPTPMTYHTQDSIVIKATPEQVWQSINHIENIKPENFYEQSKLLPFMNVPTPKSAITVWEGNSTEGQWVRKCEWYGGIKFDEPVISQVPNRQLRWQFVFYPDSVPPNTLDDHVTINGEHFKLLHGQYDLESINEYETKLTFNVTYRITTNINSYAGFWGKWVMNEFIEDTLGLYKRRLEAI